MVAQPTGSNGITTGQRGYRRRSAVLGQPFCVYPPPGRHPTFLDLTGGFFHDETRRLPITETPSPRNCALPHL